ncbi:cell division protein FtsZ [candidate division CSSED10-310 bacterium]|uniref:Cell division protein FtsZ n=1 Tax=candidate division CSSED10-310 bacterium TaxID=2855610 RepID=A0ABV6YV03_UNCC1
MTNFTFEVFDSNKARIKVIGVGGGGTNAVNYMINKHVQGVDFFIANTDMQSLEASPAPHKIQLGTNLTRGLGTGNKPNLGRDAAEEAADKIDKIMENTDMVFITAGMGGGTGTGASPVFAKVARDHGILTVGVVTKPFSFEQKIRAKHAEEGITELRKHVDTLIIIPNERLLQISDRKLSIIEAFDMADNVLLDAVRGISDVIVVPSRVNVDFADVQTIMSNMGDALMGTGFGEGDNGATAAISNAIHCPLLERASVKGAKGILINYVGGKDLALNDINEANKIVVEEADKSANVIWGLAIDESYEKKVKITVIATGFGKDNCAEEEVVFEQMMAEAGLSNKVIPEISVPKQGVNNHSNRPVEKVKAKPFFDTITEEEIYNGSSPPSSGKDNLDTPAFLRRGKYSILSQKKR